MPLEDADQQFPPWVPETLRGAVSPDELEHYWYVVIDEIVGDGLGLAIAPWPGTDDRGRLRFVDTGEADVFGAQANEFEQFINRYRVVVVMATGGALDEETAKRLQTRELQIGDAFAIPEDLLTVSEGRAEPADAKGSRIYDITFEARTEAKLAMAAALAPALSASEAERFIGGEPPDDAPTVEGEPPKPQGAGPGGVVLGTEELGEPEV